MLRYLLILAFAAVAFAQMVINTPQNVQACSPYTVTWTGGTGPYILLVLPGGNPSAAPLETHTGINAPPYTWNVIESAGTALFLRVYDANGVIAETATFTVQSSTNCGCTTTTVTQKTLPGAGQCNSGDTGTTLSSSSTCAALTADGSSIYVGTGVTACCENIPAGTFVCTTPPPPPACTNYVPTNGPGVTQCSGTDRSFTLTDTSTCDFLTNVLGVTMNQLYTVSGSNICCTSIPSGTTLCVPTAPPPPQCPTNSLTTTTSTQTSTTTTTTSTSTSTTTTAPSGPTNVSGYKSSQYLGCYVDSVATRVLPIPMGIPQLTVELCIDACTSAGFPYAGVEYSGECYCGSTAPSMIATDGRCYMPCSGNNQEICGGPNGLSVYSSPTTASILQSYGSWTYTGCYEDSVAARTMPVAVTAIDGNSMTVEKCLDACYSRGYSFAGLEYAQECYCASALPPTPATDGRCDMLCKGNNMEYCGGGNGLTVYSYQYSPPYSRRAY